MVFRDENLSDRLIPRILDLYPGSEHVKPLSLTKSEDVVIWEYVKTNYYVIVSNNTSDSFEPGLIARLPIL